MFTKAIRTSALTFSAAICIVAQTPITLTADQPTGSLIPVPPMRSVPQPLDSHNRANGQSTAARQLSWRPSQKIEPNQAEQPAQVADQQIVSQTSTETAARLIPSVQPSSNPIATAQPAVPSSNSVGALIAQSTSPRITQTSAAGASRNSVISQATYTQDATEFGAGGFSVPSGDGLLPPRIAAQPQSDPFSDPFNDGRSAAQATEDRLIIRPQEQDGGFMVPPSLENIPVPDSNLQTPPNFAPSPFQANGDSTPSPLEPSLDSQLNSPSDQSSNFEPQTGDAEEASEEPGAGRFEPYRRLNPPAEIPESKSKVGEYETESCDDLRTRIAARDIQSIELDISPPFRPDILEKDVRDAKYNDFREAQLPRTWRTMNGNILAEGEFVGLEFENAIIRPSVGPDKQIPLARLSEPDLEYITEQWGLPRECQLPNIAFQPRQWLPTTMTWKASGLCHKPLYFEEVNLERYGHTAGPFAQPVLSTAHFFVNIAVLPYKMGIHPPNECQYALGYYRPGNCAPWIIPPVPISLRGALFEAGAIGAGIALIP